MRLRYQKYTLTYKENADGTCSVTGVSCSGPTGIKIKIPSVYEGMPVTAIGDFAFRYCLAMTDVVIPDTVTRIGDGAFLHCSSLRCLILPENVMEIGSSAFQDCINLTSVIVPDGVTRVGWLMFPGYSILERIGAYAFSGCTALADFALPKSLKEIGDGAFADCRSLTQITIPDNVTRIGAQAFSDCIGLTVALIPEGITQIFDETFFGCIGIKYISLPSGLTSIGDGAFGSCSSLLEAEVPSSVTHIGKKAFGNCTSLTDIKLPKAVSGFSVDMLDGCSRLQNKPKLASVGFSVITDAKKKTCTVMGIGSCEDNEIIIPEEIDGYRVTRIGYGAFRGCDTLKSIVIPDSVTEIGEKAFWCCSALADVSIRGNGTKIGNYAFRHCAALTRISVSDGVKTIGEKAFADCASLMSVTLPKDVSGFCPNMLDGCVRLRNAPKLPSVGLSRLSDGGRKKCVIMGRGSCKDASVIIPAEIDGSRVTRIGASAFADRKDLKAVFIPAGVERIDEKAFAGCTALKEIRFGGTTAQWEKISFGASWNNPIGTYTIICADGNLPWYRYC